VNDHLKDVMQGLSAIFYNLSSRDTVQDYWMFYLVGIVALFSLTTLYFIKKYNRQKKWQRTKRLMLLLQDKVEDDTLRSVSASFQYQGVAGVQERAIQLFTQGYFAVQDPVSKVMQLRIEVITQRAILALFNGRTDALEILSDPDVQHNLQIIQKEFASTGDEDMAELLVAVFLHDAQQPRKMLAQTIGNQALSALTKLTQQQLDVISLLYLLKNTRDVKNTCFAFLQEYMTTYIVPFSTNLPYDIACFQHVEDCGCAVISPVSLELERVLLDSYPAVFTYMGFTSEEMKEVLGGQILDENRLVLSLFDTQLWKLNAIDDELATKLLYQAGLNDTTVLLMQKLQHSRPAHCSEEGVRGWLPHIHPQLSQLSEVWNGSLLQVMQLSVLGIYIAQANIKRRLGETVAMEIWINNK